MAGEADDLLSSILGNADPGDNGKADEGGFDTGPVEDNDDQDADLENLDADHQDDNDEEDAGDDAGADDQESDPLTPKKRGRPKKDQQQDDDQGDDGDENAPESNDPFAPNAKLTTDKTGNVFVNGKLVAKGGREARMFMGFRKSAVRDRDAATRAVAHTAKIAEGARELYTRYETLKSQKTLFEGAGLSSEEQAQLLPIAIAYKKNPVEGIKMLLTRAHMAGVDIKSLGGAGALDPKVLMDDMKAFVAEQLKPVHSQTTESANQEKLRKEATGFFQRNPDAKDVARMVGGSHKLGNILNEAKKRAPDLTLDELFGQLHYALLRQFKGQLPTGPVAKKPAPKNARKPERKMERNFRSSVSKNPQNPSFEDIAQSVLRDAAAAESRGF